jgi:hypothetical protein
MTHKKNEYFMFFVVDGVNDPAISDPHFVFSLEGTFKGITKSIRVALNTVKYYKPSSLCEPRRTKSRCSSSGLR